MLSLSDFGIRVMLASWVGNIPSSSSFRWVWEGWVFNLWMFDRIHQWSWWSCTFVCWENFDCWFNLLTVYSFAVLFLRLLQCQCYSSWCCTIHLLSNLLFFLPDLLRWVLLPCLLGYWSFLHLHIVWYWGPLAIFLFSYCIIQLCNFFLVLNIFYHFRQVFIVFIHSSPEFSEHLCVHCFERLIR